MYRIELLPAERGDCIWVTYGTASEPRHVLIDGGPTQTMTTLVPLLANRLAGLPGASDTVELLVQTHIDADHIQGLTSLLSNPRWVTAFRDIWFNGYQHIMPGHLGARDGEMLTESLAAHPERWNAAFGGKAVVAPSAPVELAGGMRLTLLAPTRPALDALAVAWKEVMKGLAGAGVATPESRRRPAILGFDPVVAAKAPFKADASVPNASGIAFVAEHDGRRVLFLADVPPKQVLAALDRLGRGVHAFDAVKMSHHASKNNTSLELCERIRSPRWLVSTNGARFGHPDPEALARVVVTQRTPTFYLNYVTPHVREFIAGAGREYRVVLPKRKGAGYAEGVTLDL